jgi:hypothetical protein
MATDNPKSHKLMRKHLQETSGREEEFQKLRAVVDVPVNAPSSFTLLVGVGGIGKTNLIQNLEEYIRHKYDDRRPVLSVFIDLQSPDVWLPEGVMDAIADGLRDWFHKDDPHFQAFASYQQALIEVMDAAVDQPNIAPALWDQAVRVFVKCYSDLAEQYRIVLLFDTMEELERNAILGVDELQKFLETEIFVLPRTTFVLSGRNTDRHTENKSESKSYNWYQKSSNLRLTLPGEAQTIKLRLLDDEEAHAFLHNVFDDLPDATFDVLPHFGEEPGMYSPIMLILLAERYRETPLPLTKGDLETRDSRERALVEAYCRGEGADDVLLYLALGWYRFDVPMIRAITNVSEPVARTKFKALQAKRFIKFIPGRRESGRQDKITLHDEMRRLLWKHKWKDLKAREADRWTHRNKLHQMLRRYFEMQDEVRPQITDSIAHAQAEFALEVWARGFVPKGDLGKANEILNVQNWGGVSKEQRDQTVQAWINQRRLEYYERVLLLEARMLLEGLKSTAVNEQELVEDLGEEIELVDRQWELWRTSQHNVYEERVGLIRQLQEQIPPGFLDKPEAHPQMVVRVRRRQIELEYEHNNDWAAAEDAYIAVYDKLRAEPVSQQSAESRQQQVRLLAWAANASVRVRETNLGEARSYLRRANEMCEAHINDLLPLRANVANLMGWISRMEWDLEGATEWYERALHYFSDAEEDPLNRVLGLALILINLGYVKRYNNPHEALLYCTTAYDMACQERRLTYMARFSRTISIIHRYIGNHEDSERVARRAVLLAQLRGRPDDEALGKLQVGTTLWYMVRDDKRQSEDAAGVRQTRLTEAEGLLNEARETLAPLAARNKYIAAELIQDYYNLAQIAAYKGDNETCEAHFKTGIDLAHAIGDEYREINGKRLIIVHRYHTDPTMTFASLRETDEYKSIMAGIEQDVNLEKSSSLFVGIVQRIAGALAQREAISTQNPRMYDTAIDFYIRAYRNMARTQGYRTVVFQDELKTLSNHMDELLTASDRTGGRSVNVLLQWCDRLDDAWKTEEELAGSWPLVENITRLFRIKARLARPALLPPYRWAFFDHATALVKQPWSDEPRDLAALLLQWCDQLDAAWQADAALSVSEPLVANITRAFRRNVEKARLDAPLVNGWTFISHANALTDQAMDGKQYDLAARLLDYVQAEGRQRFEIEVPDSVLLRRAIWDLRTGQPETAHEVLDGLFHKYQAADSQPFMPNHPDACWHTQWLDDVDWNRLLIASGRALLVRDQDSVLEGVKRICSSVQQSHSLNLLRGRSKHLLAQVLRYFGFLAEATQWLERSLVECAEDQDDLFVAYCLNDLADYIALQGQDQAASQYAEQAYTLMSTLGQTRGVLEANLTLGAVYRAWAGYAASRGSVGLVEEQHSKASDYFQAALASPAMPETPPHGESKTSRARPDRFQLQVFRELGTTYRRWGRYYRQHYEWDPAWEKFGLAAQYLEKALEANPDPREKGAVLNGLGRVRHEQALIVMQRAPDDVVDYMKQAAECWEHSLDLANEQNHYTLQVNNLALLLELRYIFSRVWPNPMIRQAYAQSVAGEGIAVGELGYQQALQDPYKKALDQLRKTFKAIMDEYKSFKVYPEIETASEDMPPDAVSHWYGRVEFVLGLLAQWEKRYNIAVDHYSLGGQFIAASGHANFNIDEMLKFLQQRFRELNDPNDSAVRRDWAARLYRDWSDVPAIRTSFSDMLTFCDLEQKHAELNL